MSTILEAGAAARVRSMETDMIACVFKITASFNHSYRYNMIQWYIYIVYSDFPSFPIVSVVLLYMVCHGSHPYTPVMLAYILAPWIRHGFDIVSNHFPIKGHQPQPASFRSTRHGRHGTGIVKLSGMPAKSPMKHPFSMKVVSKMGEPVKKQCLVLGHLGSFMGR